MSDRNLSAEEAAVHRHLAAAKEEINHLEAQISNLASDKGPQLKPEGGPLTRSNAYLKVKLEKQLATVKEEMLRQVDKELKHAAADVRDRCHYEVDKVLYTKPLEAEQKKDIGASQAYLMKDRMERKMPQEQAAKPLEKSDRKDIHQSAQYMFQTRYGQELPAADQQLLEGKDIKTLDQSQDYAYLLRYRGEPADKISNLKSRDIDIERD